MPVFTIPSAALDEAWSPEARAASAAVRQGRAKYAKDLQGVTKKRQQQAKAKSKASAKAGKDAEAEAKKAESEKWKATAKGYDDKLKGVAAELHAMTDRKSAAYHEKYAAYRALQDEKRVALGGAHRVEAPQKEPKPKAER